MVRLLRRFANPPALSATIALIVFAITLNGAFIYDDVAVIEKDPRIADPRLWGQYWTDSYNFGVDNLYRPLVSMSYAIQHWVHGPRPMPFHMVNWILHAIASALVAMFAMRLAEQSENDVNRSRAIGFVAGILFAVHPVHVEAVANVVGRAELMCLIGVVGAMHLFLRPLTPGRVAGIYACFVLALLSKEQGMLVPLLLGVMMATSRLGDRAQLTMVRAHASTRVEEAVPVPDDDTPPRATPPGPILFLLLSLTLAGYVVYRESILKFWWDKNFLDTWIQPLAAPGVTPQDRLLVPISIAGRYLQLLVAPLTLRIDYGGLIVPGRFDARDPFFYLGLAAIALWVGLFFHALKRRDRFSLFCLLGFAILYGLVGNIVTIIGVNVAERLMYLPSAFFVMIVARWMSRLRPRAILVLLTSISVLFTIRSVTYAFQWNDKLRLYRYAAEVEPRALKAVQLVLREYLDGNQPDAAEPWAMRAIDIAPERDDVYLQLASVRIEQQRFAEARELVRKAQDLNPAGKASAYYQLIEDAERAAAKGL